MLGALLLLAIVVFGLLIMFGKAEPDRYYKFLIFLIIGPILLSIGFNHLIWFWLGLPLWAQVIGILLLPFLISATLRLVLFAANDFCTPADRVSSEYADLVAIRFCTSRSFLPWTGKPNYRFPEYLRGVVSESTGELDFSALDRRIAELRPYVDV